MKKLDLSSMKSKVIERPVERAYMDDYREKIRNLRQRLYSLMRIQNDYE